MPNPTPDQHGRYRVRRKGDPQSPSWSTRIYNPDKHVIVPGDASDTYGAALPPGEQGRTVLDPPLQTATTSLGDIQSPTTTESITSEEIS